MISYFCFGRYYHIVVIEHLPGSNLRDTSSYTLQALGPYDVVTYKPGIPYITAEISADSFVSKFAVGDGKDFSRSNRKRRHAGKIKYSNAALKPNTKYFIFQRAFLSNVSFEFHHLVAFPQKLHRRRRVSMYLVNPIIVGISI